MKSALMLFLLLIQGAFAISEENFAQVYQQEVLPYFAQSTQSSFINEQGMKINYYSLTSPSNTKTLVILPGRTEPAKKYAELVYDLRAQNFNVFILDHQGQGESDRLLGDTEKGHVIRFHDYIRDLDQWMETVVVPETQNQERYLFAHSMGGAIAATYLARSQTHFKKALLTSPMLGINTAPYGVTFARILANVLNIVHLGNCYAPKRESYIPEHHTLERSEETQSQARLDVAKDLFVSTPELAVGGPTTHWVLQTLKMAKSSTFLSTEIKIPLLVNTAGVENIVLNSYTTSFCARSSNCTLVNYANAKHEIFMEKDILRDEAIRQMIEFFN
jgi:lysophospholipase